jgi:hypothetical protein
MTLEVQPAPPWKPTSLRALRGLRMRTEVELPGRSPPSSACEMAAYEAMLGTAVVDRRDERREGDEAVVYMCGIGRWKVDVMGKK